MGRARSRSTGTRSASRSSSCSTACSIGGCASGGGPAPRRSREHSPERLSTMKNSKAVWIALGAFALLLVLVLATREREVKVGVRSLERKTFASADVTRVELTGAKSALLRKHGEGWTVADPARPDRAWPAD